MQQGLFGDIGTDINTFTTIEREKEQSKSWLPELKFKIPPRKVEETLLWEDKPIKIQTEKEQTLLNQMP